MANTALVAIKLLGKFQNPFYYQDFVFSKDSFFLSMDLIFHTIEFMFELFFVSHEEDSTFSMFNWELSIKIFIDGIFYREVLF